MNKEVNEIAKKIAVEGVVDYLGALGLLKDIIDKGGKMERIKTIADKEGLQGLDTYRVELMFYGGI